MTFHQNWHVIQDNYWKLPVNESSNKYVTQFWVGRIWWYQDRTWYINARSCQRLVKSFHKGFGDIKWPRFNIWVSFSVSCHVISQKSWWQQSYQDFIWHSQVLLRSLSQRHQDTGWPWNDIRMTLYKYNYQICSSQIVITMLSFPSCSWQIDLEIQYFQQHLNVIRQCFSFPSL